VTVATVETRWIGSVATSQGPEGYAELDSHADTCVAGDKTAFVIQDYGQPISVVGYDRSVGAAQCSTMQDSKCCDSLCSSTNRTGQVVDTFINIWDCHIFPMFTTNSD